MNGTNCNQKEECYNMKESLERSETNEEDRRVKKMRDIGNL